MVTTGREEIAARGKGLHLLGLRLASEGTPIQFGRYVAPAASVPGDPETGWILVYELDKDGKIAHHCVIGGTPSTAGGDPGEWVSVRVELRAAA